MARVFQVARSAHLIACKDCDAVWQVPSGSTATFRCQRCSSVVSRFAPDRLDVAFALYTAAGICFLIANYCPILAIQAQGIEVRATILGAVLALQGQQMTSVAALVGLTIIIVPAVEIVSVWLLVLSAQLHASNRWIGAFYRIREKSRSWGMVEIFVLGVLVAIVKLAAVSRIVLGAGSGFLAAFLITHAAAAHAFEPEDVWNRLPQP